MRRSTRTLALSVALLAGGAARGNGRFPTAQQVVFGAGEHAGRVTFRVTFGLLVSNDDARSFRWLCEEAMFSPATPGPAVDPAVEIDAQGRTLFGYGSGVRAWSPDACGVRVLPDLAEREVIDLAITPDLRTIYGVETTPGTRQWVLRASADDLAFTRQGAGVAGVRLSTLDVAPSDPRRLYVGGLDEGTRAPVVLRSDDAGETLLPVNLAPSLLGDEAFVAGVDPVTADNFWLRTNSGLGSTLVRVRGVQAEVVARSSDAMLGFARSGDGRTVWYGSVAGGLFRSTDGGDLFERVSELAIYCLAVREGELWACGDWLRGPFALGRSVDGGRSFTPVLRFEDVAGPVTCAGEGAASCEPRWPTLRDDLLTPPRRDAGAQDAAARDAARDAPSADAGALGELRPPPPSGGCACSAVAPARRRPLALALLAAGWTIARRRRRSRASVIAFATHLQ
ncbi:MAG: hypothetical protein R3A48_02465 [Polyangiales bacterium]